MIFVKTFVSQNTKCYQNCEKKQRKGYTCFNYQDFEWNEPKRSIPIGS